MTLAAAKYVFAGLLAAGVAAANEGGECAAGEVGCGDQSILLQTHAAVGEHAFADGARRPAPWFTWRTGSTGASCDQVCSSYVSACVPEGFANAGSVSGADTAARMATGSGCPLGPPSIAGDTYAPFAPYIDKSARSTCRYYPDTWVARCGTRPEPWAQRICPCSAMQPQQQCKQLSGQFCPGTELACNCNYCDDFKNHDACANACRVMNGYTRAPPGFDSDWTATRNYSPNNANSANCICDWMGNNGLGDDCKKCDTCALACRRANLWPKGTCR